ncbi:MAG: two-component sensor histidine kinase, partial [Alphaproteobacteria bacterium]|nr:two-component sensor histidine kinase [Alphaproteobacteria bacterium]
FTRLESERPPDIGGTGLGLTIARDIVLSHGGTIDISDSPLGGARVKIKLPI